MHCNAEDVKEGFEVHFVQTFDEVFRLALDYDKGAASDLPQAAAAG
jgi:hypothetical protein